MFKAILATVAVLASLRCAAAHHVLIVADEFPAMEVLAERLRADEGLASRLVRQTELPASLEAFRAVVVYIHGRLLPGPERAMVEYTRAGGRLVALHHSISSGKRTNELWFPFLGVELPQKNVAEGGYRWIEPVTLEVVNLAPEHFIATNRVHWPQTLAYTRETGASLPAAPAFTLPESEVYLNHTFTAPRTVLLGFMYTDAATGRVWMQDRAAWYRPVDKGWLFYFQPGHSVRDFENPVFSRLVVNAVVFAPPAQPLKAR